ncbi:MAG: hypothetical protein MR957_05450 [Lachnobacterium sp.]|nr:hypothetical protein [Lachnobacterium sp.]
MKSKIVRQLGAMLLAGAMLVTSGNVTTYAEEQTDESVEVDIAQNEALYGAEMDDVEKLEKGDGYFICKELLNGKEKYVAYILIDKTERSIDDILKDIANSRYMTAGNVVAITTVKKIAKIDSNIIKKVRKYKWNIKLCARFYNPMDYHDIYFEKMNDEDKEYSFKVTYNTDESVIDNLKNKGILGYSFSIDSTDKNNVPYEKFMEEGEVGLYECVDNDFYKQPVPREDMRLYYYDENRDKYVLFDRGMYFSCDQVINNRDADRSYMEVKSSKINCYGTYIVCSADLPESMVFNLTGLEKSGDNLLYYKNGLRDTSYTGLCDYNGNTYYVKNGSVDYSANMLYDYNGSTWNIKNGKVDKTESVTMNNGSLVYTKDGKTSNETTLCKYNGEWYYIHNGKVDYNANTLCKYNGSWWYVQNGKVNFKYNGLCKYNGSWWYVSGGRVNFNATGLCKYNGSWWYVSSGKVNFNATGLCKYNGTWWYVSSGKVNFNATGLCKYNGSWWYVSSGKVNFNATGLCKYNGTWWYVSKGKVNFNATGLCKFNGNWFYVEKGAVRFKTTLCKYNGTWWYVNNGVVNFSKTTLCKYGKNWYAVSKGKVAWNYTGYVNYNGKNYKVVKGIVKF